MQRKWINPRKMRQDRLFRPEFETGTSIFQVSSFVVVVVVILGVSNIYPK